MQKGRGTINLKHHFTLNSNARLERQVKVKCTIEQNLLGKVEALIN